MAITTKWLEEIGLTAEQAQKVFAERGKEITETKTEHENALNTVKTELEKAQETITTLEENKADVDKLNATIEQYKQAEAERIAIAEKEKQHKIYVDEINSQMNGKEFINEFTADSIVSKVKELHSKDNTKGIDFYFKQLTEGKDGIFKSQNPGNKAEIPPTGSTEPIQPKTLAEALKEKYSL